MISFRRSAAVVALSALTVLAVASAAGQEQAPDLIRGLVAWYPLDGTANDETGHGADGRVVGATPVADRFGRENSAYAFDGEDREGLPQAQPK